jgi:DNA-binding NarL/FixJ family response regulator
MTVRVVLVDDQTLVRAGFRMIVEAEPDLEVVGEAADGRQAVEVVAALCPDVVLMDVRMPEVDGIEATRRIMADLPEPPKVLVLTTFDLDEHAYAAIQAGASGFLLKEAPPEQLVAGIRTVAAGEQLLAPSVTRRLIERFSNAGPPTSAPPVEGLTAREQEVLALVARAMTNAEIAAHLFVSETTVKTHVARILMKLGLRDRVQAVVLAYESGLVRGGA